MKYNPLIHHRRSIRLKGYDYSKAGAYFITICCEDRIHRFGKVSGDEMILNQSGTIAYNEWINLAERFPNFELDVFQIFLSVGVSPTETNFIAIIIIFLYLVFKLSLQLKHPK